MKWLPRNLVTCPMHLALCTNPKEFGSWLKEIELPKKYWPEFVTPGKKATCHFIVVVGIEYCVCCVSEQMMGSIATYGLLVHEAVHVWQNACKTLGEKQPGNEIEAYSIQRISVEFMKAYDEQTGRRKTAVSSPRTRGDKNCR